MKNKSIHFTFIILLSILLLAACTTQETTPTPEPESQPISETGATGVIVLADISDSPERAGPSLYATVIDDDILNVAGDL